MKTLFLLVNWMMGLWIVLASVCDAADVVTPVVRWPAAAGINYPAQPEQLLAMVRDLCAKADVPEVPLHLSAVVASAGPYKFAGEISAHAFASLQPGQYERVIVIGPSHGPLFENCSIPAVDLFLTPLGPVPLDAAAVRYLLYSPLFHSHQMYYNGGKSEKRIHEYEFSLEGLLPFLQERLLEFQLVPILTGDLRDPQGKVNKNTLKAIANAIQPIVNERTLVVVATSFTHYGSEYNALPFKEDIENNIAHFDRLAFEHLLALDIDGFRDYLEKTRNFIDGKDCLQILLYLLPKNAQARLLAYGTSMAKTHEKDHSVSYAALVFHDPARPALSPQPDKVRPLTLRRPEKTITPPEGEKPEVTPVPSAKPGDSATPPQDDNKPNVP